MTTDTLTLTDFLLARIAEDEAVARDATPGPWSVHDEEDEDPIILAAEPHPESVWSNDFGVDQSSRYVAATSYDGLSNTTYNSEADAAHIARHDPARVLAECEAKRRLIEDLAAEKHEVVDDCWYTCAAAVEDIDGGETCDDARRDGACDCGRDFRVNRRLGILASIYADHPDFRDEWRA